MNIYTMLSHLQSGKKMRRKSWNDGEYIAVFQINDIDGEFVDTTVVYNRNSKVSLSWKADYEDLYADDWEVYETCNCSEKCKVCSCKEKYYTTREIAKELNVPVKKIYEILVKDDILRYDTMKKTYMMVDKTNDVYVNYKVNYKKTKCFRLKWNELGREKLINYINDALNRNCD